jgi:hypothetical protein
MKKLIFVLCVLFSGCSFDQYVIRGGVEYKDIRVEITLDK